MLNYINSKWSLRRRLLLICALAAFPSAYFMRVIFVTDMQLLTSTQSELLGLDYEEQIWRTLVSADRPVMREIAAKYDQKFGTAALSAEYLADTNPASRISKGIALIDKVSGSSGIALDPESGTYYLGDIIIARLPTVYAHLSSLKMIAEKVNGVDANKGGDIRVSAALLQAQLDALEADVRWLESDTNSAGVAAKLKSSLQTVAALGQTAKTLSAAGNVDMKVLRELGEQGERAVDNLFQAGARELRSMLDKRSADLWMTVIWKVGLGAFFIVAGTGCALLFARSMVKAKNDSDAYYQGEHEKFLQAVTGACHEFSEGKFGHKINEAISADYQPIADEFNRVGEHLIAINSRILEAEHANQAILSACDKTQARIEFGLDGTILAVNQTYEKVIGYSAAELVGKNQSTFLTTEARNNPQTVALWEDLKRGEYRHATTHRMAKDGHEVLLLVHYCPIRTLSGALSKIIAFAVDITDFTKKSMDLEGQVEAILKTQGVIEFDLDGIVVTANPNFLSVVGYSLDEVKGRHHRMFVGPSESAGAAYQQFWDDLRHGNSVVGEFRRVGKEGKEVWLQAVYTPIMDFNGKPLKVIKYAMDITAKVRAEQALKAAVVELSDAIGAAKANDLTKRIKVDGKEGAVAELCSGVNGLLDTMSGVIANIASSSGVIANASRELAMGNTELSQRTEEQAASLEETAASLGEFTTTVKQNAENAQKANDLATAASQVAIKGGQVVAEVISTMDGISQASRKIADIIGVIDEISFQTNILALNAAVEAARAGEQGRGFAVVASEVRSLAQRSTNAAKEIKTLISDSVARVETGAKLVESAGKTMEDLVSGVEGVSRIMADISAASREQSEGIEQVNTAVMQMDKITQQNAALVEEAAAAAKSMEEQTATLESVVASFQIDGGGARSSLGAPRRPAVAATGNPVVDKAFRKAGGGLPAPRLAKPVSKPVAVSKPSQARAKRAASGGGDWTEF